MRSACLRHPTAALLALALVMSLALPAWAGAPTERVKSGVDQVVRILEDQAAAAPERRAAIRRVAEGMFDFRELSRRALGRHWPGLSESDREEFVGLFAGLLERAYISQFERYSGERIAYAGESVQGGIATVRTRLTMRDGGEVHIDYRLAGQGDRWRVADVLVEGVSLTASYRSQFDKVIQTSSFRELLRRMRTAAATHGGAERQGS